MNAIAQIHAEASSGAASHMRRVNVLADVLTDELKRLHGGDWRFTYDELSEFVIIARQPAKARAV